MIKKEINTKVENKDSGNYIYIYKKKKNINKKGETSNFTIYFF